MDAQLEQLHKRQANLRKKLLIQEAKDDVASMERSLRITSPPAVAEPPSVRSAPSVISVRSKRTAAESNLSSDDEREIIAVPIRGPGTRGRPPPEYRGTSIREHKEFVRACELLFRRTPAAFVTDSSKIIKALPYLEGEPADEWEREEQRVGVDYHTWETFKQYLLDAVSDPTNRLFTQAQRHADCKQRPGQKVQAFLTYLEGLEAQLPPYGEEQKRQILLTKLRPELRKALMTQPVIPATRRELARLATRLEENLDPAPLKDSRPERNHGPSKPHDGSWSHPRGEREGREKRDRSDRGKKGRFPQRTGYTGGTTPATTVNRTSTTTSTQFVKGVECYNCGKMGHYANSCNNPPTKTSKASAAAKPTKN